MLLALASPALAGDCRIALELALDVSSSVDAAEDRLQREGLARALVAPEVMRAFLTGDPVALYAFQSSGPSSQASILPGWVMFDGPEDPIRISSVIGGPNEEGLTLRDRRVSDRRLLAWFTHAVLHGPGAFSILVDGYDDYERAMEAKLLRELELPLVSELPVAEGGAGGAL